jgi:hypothetical protein
MSLQKSLILFTFILIVAADVLGFMANAGMGVTHAHATIGLLAALACLLSVIAVFRAK